MELSNFERAVELRARYLRLEDLRRHNGWFSITAQYPGSAPEIFVKLTPEELNEIIDRLCRATILALNDLGVSVKPASEL